MHQAAGCCNNHIWIKQKPFKLIFHVVTANDQTMRKVRILGQLLEIIGGLDCQLASRSENYTSSANDCAVGFKFFDDWDAKSAGLATACSSHGDDVETLQNDWNSSALDWRRQVVAFLLDGLIELWT